MAVRITRDLNGSPTLEVGRFTVEFYRDWLWRWRPAVEDDRDGPPMIIFFLGWIAVGWTGREDE